MIEIREVRSKKEQKDFLNFPLRLYKNNPYFVPPLMIDEKKIFRKNYVYYDTCEAVYYNAYRDGRMVGRISGILQKASNKKTGEKRIRFTRFDTIDDYEVSEALFAAVEEWGREKGMDTICGPLGFSDLEREGLLIEGFDQLSTFEEQYTAPYYPRHLEHCGYAKEVDWFESQIRSPKNPDDNLNHMEKAVMERYGLRWGPARSINDFIRRYGDDFFALLDTSYEDIYGTVPFTEGMKKMMYSNFRLIMKLKYVGVLLNEKDEMVGLGICFPSLSKALQPSGGRLTPAALIRVLRAIRKPKVIDFGLIGIAPEYLKKGVPVCMVNRIIRLMNSEHIEHAETNLNLENNAPIRNLWKRFDAVEHKKRRSYIKQIRPTK